MSSTGCLTDATNVDSEDKTTVGNAGKPESEIERNARIRKTENASWPVLINERGLALPRHSLA